MGKTVIGIFIILFTCLQIHAQEKTLQPKSVLILGPAETFLPVSEEERTVDEKSKQLISFEQLPIAHFQPAPGTEEGTTGLVWNEKETSDGSVTLSGDITGSPQIYYTAVYIHCEKFSELTLTVSSCNPFIAYFDNEEIGKNTEAPVDEDCKVQEVEKKVKVPRGRYLLIVKSAVCEAYQSDHSLSVRIDGDEGNVTGVRINTDPERFAGIDQLLYDPKITKVDISADGNNAVVFTREYVKGEDKPETGMLFYNAKTGEKLRSHYGSKTYSQFSWLPMGNNYSYVAKNNGKSTLYLGNMQQGDTEVILEDIDDFGSYTWANDASFLVYSVTEKIKGDESGVVKLRDLSDRGGIDRNKTHLYLLDSKTGAKRKITEYDSTAYLVSIHPDGNSLLYGIGGKNYAKRPYGFTALYEYDIKSGESDSLMALYFSRSISYTPDGNKLLITGGPSVFGEIGFAIDYGTIANDYDIQAYLYDLKTGEVEAISKSFDPSLGSMYFAPDGKSVYFTATERTYTSLFKYDMTAKTFEKVNLPVDVLQRIAFANNAPYAVYSGSNATSPVKSYRLNLTDGSSEVLFDPNEKSFRYTKTGETSEFNYTKEDGTVIEGLVYYPPDYTQEKDYPCIVYYYGGTSPVTRGYEGRYPKNIWAANGYFVYVIQPSGATGYGQEFSTRHVNDWGITTGKEIIDATKHFLDHHPIVDPNRVGCIGASYGGYMTMNVLTKTDLFSAAVSHAGISSLSSYWGEGDWGYLYSAVATANSFPWNRKDLYVDESPLFNADNVNTPLLLIHGDIDNNVPPGESKQFYTALKLLGKEVEMILVEGQQHWVLDIPKRERWTKSIIAWFDKYLKGEAGWWNELFTD